MKKYFLAILLIFSLLACRSKQTQKQDYLSDNERDSLLVNIITYIYVPATGANNKTKFDTKYRDFYVKSLPNFKLKLYELSPDGWHYFFVIRPVGNSSKFKRGVLGKFKLAPNSLKIIQFEEIVNTPHLTEQLLIERGSFLFKELTKNKNLDKYLSLKHYVEWPDASLIYDKSINEWKSRN